MSEERKEFARLNLEYQKCLNQYYDKFFEGEDIQLDNVCIEELEKLKKVGDYYKNMTKEYLDFRKNNDKNKK